MQVSTGVPNIGAGGGGGAKNWNWPVLPDGSLCCAGCVPVAAESVTDGCEGAAVVEAVAAGAETGGAAEFESADGAAVVEAVAAGAETGGAAEFESADGAAGVAIMFAPGAAAGTGAERPSPALSGAGVSGIAPPFGAGNAMPAVAGLPPLAGVPPLAVLAPALGGMAATLAQVSAISIQYVYCCCCCCCCCCCLCQRICIDLGGCYSSMVSQTSVAIAVAVVVVLPEWQLCE